MSVTRSQLEAMNPGALNTLAEQVGNAHSTLTQQAEAHEHVSRNLGEAWRGTSADKAAGDVDDHTARIRSNTEGVGQLRTALSNAGNDLTSARSNVLGAVARAESNGFKVGDDWSLTDTSDKRGMARATAQRDIRDELRSAVSNYDQKDQTHSQTTKAALDTINKVNTAAPGDSPDQQKTKKKCPTVGSVGNPGPLEQTKEDLDATWADGSGDKGIRIGGDHIPKSAPRIHGGGIPNDPDNKDMNDDGEITTKPWKMGGPDGTKDADGKDYDPYHERPIPTGTILCGNKRFAMFSTPRSNPDQDETPEHYPYTTTSTIVMDYSDINNPQYVGRLDGIAQASGFCDGNTMYIVGNKGAGANAPRAMWSAPFNPSNPHDWVSKVNSNPVGTYPDGVGGDRENQAIALRGGGFLQLDTGDGGVRGWAACNPKDLLTPGQDDVKPIAKDGSLPNPRGPGHDKCNPYGPTVVHDGTSRDSNGDGVDGEVVVRVSAWDGGQPYAPGTCKLSIQIKYVEQQEQ